MYKFTKDIDLNEAMGNSIKQWNASRHSVGFNIGNVSFLVESIISIEKNGIPMARWSAGEDFDQIFNLALGKSIIGYNVPSVDHLVITLEDDISIRIIDENEKYESVAIKTKDNIYII